jgi:hypothetical protein
VITQVGFGNGMREREREREREAWVLGMEER